MKVHCNFHLYRMIWCKKMKERCPTSLHHVGYSHISCMLNLGYELCHLNGLKVLFQNIGQCS